MLYSVSATAKTVKQDFHCFLSDNENVNDRYDSCLQVYAKNISEKKYESQESYTYFWLMICFLTYNNLCAKFNFTTFARVCVFALISLTSIC